MRVIVPAETKAGEKRVALLPDIISKLTRAGLTVAIQSGAGAHAGSSDDAFVGAGASVFSAADLDKELAGAGVVLSVQPLSVSQASKVKRGAGGENSLKAAADLLATAKFPVIQIGRAHV